MATNFTKLLDEGIQMAYNAFNSKEQEMVSGFKEQFRKENGLKKLMDKKAKLEAEKEIIINKMSEIEAELNRQDPKVTKEQQKELMKLTGNEMYSRANMSDAYAKIEYAKTQAYKNQENFKKLRAKYNQMMALAIGAKEQRHVLGEFYNLDWQQLGIELPIDVNINSVIIENGEIIINKALPPAGK